MAGYFVDVTPQEPPLVEACAKYESTLKSYDQFTFECDNGVSLKRGGNVK